MSRMQLSVNLLYTRSSVSGYGYIPIGMVTRIPVRCGHSQFSRIELLIFVPHNKCMNMYMYYHNIVFVEASSNEQHCS